MHIWNAPVLQLIGRYKQPTISIWLVYYARFVENQEKVGKNSECMNFAKYVLQTYNEKPKFGSYHNYVYTSIFFIVLTN